MSLNVYDWISYKDYEATYYSDWRYPRIITRQLTQVERYEIPGVMQLNSLAKGYNNFTEYCDKHLSRYGEQIRDTLIDCNSTFGTYLYMGGTLMDRTDKTSGTVVFRIPGCTCGHLDIIGCKIVNIKFYDAAIYGGNGIRPVYNLTIMEDLIFWWPPNKYKVDYIEYGGQRYE